MVEYKDRRVMRQELASSGYSMEYLDEWQPKTTLYRHAPGMTVNGDIAFPVGTEVPNVPGNPDYVLRKARIGMLPYPPNDACTCRWCKDRAASKQPKATPAETRCEVEGCSWVATAATERGRKGSLSLHVRRTHSA
jgi:hypothetical protein